MGSNPAAPTIIPAAAALLAAALVLFGPQILNDGDTYLHVAAGEWMLNHRAVLRTDPFSHTFAGKPWMAHEWLSEVLMGTAFRVGGLPGVLILFAIAGGLAYGLLARDLLRWLPPVPAIAALAVAGACVAPSLLARPHLLALPLLEIWTAALLRARSEGRTPPGWLLALIALWANLHGSFVIGLGLAAAVTLEAVATRREPAGLNFVTFTIAAVIAAALTPWMWDGLLFPFQLAAIPSLGRVSEWQPPDFSRLQPIELAVAALLYACLRRGVRMAMLEVLILLVLLMLAFGHARHQLIAGFVGVLVAAGPIGRTFALPHASGRPRHALALAWLAPALLLLAALRTVDPPVPTDGPTRPVSAIDHLPPALAAAPMLNDYGFGAYMIFRGLHPFIDSRAELYGDDFMNFYLALVTPGRPELVRLLEPPTIQWTIFPPDSTAIPTLDALPGWRRLYADPVAVIHVRQNSGR